MRFFWQDLRYALRTTLSKPGLAAVVVLTLALGIGATTAIFSIVYGVLIRPLPFKEPDRLVGLRETFPNEGAIPLAYRTFAEWRDRNGVFEAVAAMIRWNPNLESGDEPVRVAGAAVSASYFSVMRVEPVIGRGFLPEEDRPGSPRVVVLSHDLWQQHFGGDPNVIGQSLRLDGRAFEVVGVMPPGLSDGNIGWLSIWTPLAIDDQKARPNRGRYLQANARLKPGVSIEQARTDLERILDLVKQDFPETHNSDYGADIRPLQDFVVLKRTRSALYILMGVVGFVLLIACANVANLLLARARAREKEIAIRLALGATRARLIRQFFTESMLLALAGAAAGLAVAYQGINLLKAFNSDAVPRLAEVGVNQAVLGFALGVTVVTALTFGLAPALASTRLNPVEALKEGARGIGQGLRHKRLRSLLVVSETALALILLICSGLAIKSYLKLTDIDPGFNLDNVLTIELRLPSLRYPDRQGRVSFYRQALGRISSLPGVETVAAVQSLPLRGPTYTDPVFIEGRPAPPPGEEPVMRGTVITSDYFRAMGIRLVNGRPFTEQEVWESGGVIIVNETFARRFWPGEDPIGKRMKAGLDSPWVTVAGVVADVVQNDFEGDTIEEMFYPYTNSVDPLPVTAMSLVLRTRHDPAPLAQAARDEIRRLDRSLPVSNVISMRQLADRALTAPRFNLVLLSLFATLALVLATVGVYGVMSYTTSQRTHEIGVRMAVGAETRDVLKLVVGQGMRLVMAGVAFGLIGALALTRLMSGLLYGVSANDPGIFIIVPLVLASVALPAVYLPARKAAKLDPVVALRHE